jgi:hypothetical protein
VAGGAASSLAQPEQDLAGGSPESEGPSILAFEVHGFVSQGAIKSSGNNYLASSRRGSLKMTEVGVNLTRSLTDRLRVGAQLFAQELGPNGNFNAKFDWFYLDYRIANWLGVRAGRAKLPLGLYNDLSDVDAARVPVLLPQSVYPVSNRNFLLAQTGVEVYGRLAGDRLGSLEYRIYGGTINLEVPNRPGSPAIYDQLSSPYVVGGRLVWDSPLDGLRVAGSLQALRLDYDLIVSPAVYAPLIAAGLVDPDWKGVAHGKVPAVIGVGSIEYAAQDLLLAAEYSRWHFDNELSVPALLPGAATSTSERLYVMAAYRTQRWFHPGLYYSLFFPEVTRRSLFNRGPDYGRQDYQHDLAVTLRFDLNAHWIAKLEGHYMHGTAGLDPNLNDGVPRSELEADWVVFLAKTTVYF